ncbi:hypothetical protein ACFOY2_32240 [Nonomuraea purpurea]|uniref:Uncharacterized protein n=1 Tax=Nonomuraea purpurea TaxID=1849276 RepID=A0ABV8GDD0_9ACTN
MPRSASARPGTAAPGRPVRESERMPAQMEVVADLQRVPDDWR